MTNGFLSDADFASQLPFAHWASEPAVAMGTAGQWNKTQVPSIFNQTNLERTPMNPAWSSMSLLKPHLNQRPSMFKSK